MEIFYCLIEYRTKGSADVRCYEVRISDHNWWSAMGTVERNILPPLSADKVYAIHLYRED